MKHHLALDVEPQPTDSTCGPTSLHAVYRYHGDSLELDQVIEEVPPLETGGTLAVQLAHHALRRGYGAVLYVYNLHIFDPTWFSTPGVDLSERLRAQSAIKDDERLAHATEAYLEYLALGGELRYEDLTASLIRRHLEREQPLLTGLNSTFLYACARERGDADLEYDDVGGFSTGHFVVLAGHDPATGEVLVADPLHDNPLNAESLYSVSMERLVGAIFLGALTYDANLLVLVPPAPSGR